MPIYTRTGDNGTTALFGGKRVSKADPLVELYGSVDELNSWLGLFKDKHLRIVQGDLFTIGSILAGWHGNLDFIEPRITEMEHWIDEMDTSLPKLTNFILPTGQMNIARSVCRRVERMAVRQKADPLIIKYLNRLSDLLFTYARFINKKQKAGEVVWSGIPRKINKLK
jgi:cob(I)alamin adenosyltransferase